MTEGELRKHEIYVYRGEWTTADKLDDLEDADTWTEKMVPSSKIDEAKKDLLSTAILVEILNGSRMILLESGKFEKWFGE